MKAKRLIRFDWAMKTLLRDKANFDILEGFLSALLEDDEIKILSLLESEMNQVDENDKFTRVDLLVEDSSHRKIYIEIQNTREIDFLESLLYASSKIIVNHQKLGEDFSNISKVISISILYFNLGEGSDYLYKGITEFKGINNGERLVIRKKAEIPESLSPKYSLKEKNIFPEYYLITVDRYKGVIQKKIDEWIYIFKNSEVAEGSTSKNIDKVEQKLAEINMTEIERKRYEKNIINWVRDKDAFRTARIDGREEGKIEEKVTLGLKMLDKGIPDITIQEVIEFTDAQMQILKTGWKNKLSVIEIIKTITDKSMY
ncbi:MAG: Rpn family recombination-promoting nuclease/putative transposase [Chitinophagaceae bacterium]|nr:Rpn family recombination-promoting nuclease/putative transposase [Chitinophagaceae bacterium]